MINKYLNDSNPVLTIKIKNHDDIEVQLFPEVAPNSVANFVDLANKNYFEGSNFHRVIRGFMIQGGSGKTRLNPIKGEFNANDFKNELLHTKGVISMARTMDPNSATSQFFLMHEDSPHLDGHYAGFGIVVKGIEVVDKIATSKTTPSDAPVEPVIIESISVTLNDYVLPAVKY